MRLVPACLAVALCSVAGCKQPKGVEVDPFELVPSDIDALFGFDLDAFAASPVGAAAGLAVASDANLSAVKRGVANCNEKLDGLKTVVGINSQTQDVFAVVQLTGIGSEDVVRCMEKEGQPDEFKIIVFETRGDVRITPQEGGGHLVILNKNTIVVSHAAFDDEVFERIENPSAREMSSVATAAKNVSKEDMWIAYTLDDADRTNFSDLPGGSGLQLVTAAVELEKGLAINTRMTFESEANAQSLRDAAPELVAEAGVELASTGLPKSFIESMKFGGEGSEVTLSMVADEDATPSIVQLGASLMAQ